MMITILLIIALLFFIPFAIIKIREMVKLKFKILTIILLAVGGLIAGILAVVFFGNTGFIIMIILFVVSQLLVQYLKVRKNNSYFITDKYYLGQKFNQIKEKLEDISEISFTSGFIKVFPDEEIYKGKDIIYLNDVWETILGVANNEIYKIAFRLKSSFIIGYNDNHHTTLKKSPVLGKIYKIFKKKYGKPDKVIEVENSNLYFWDTQEGNTIFEKGKDLGKGSIINICHIFLTSQKFLDK